MTKTDKPQDTVSSLADLMSNVQLAGFKSMPDACTHWLENMSGMGSEIMTFTATRIKKDVQTAHDLLHAKGVAEFQHIQAQFFQKAIEDYAVETARLFGSGETLPHKAPNLIKAHGGYPV